MQDTHKQDTHAITHMQDTYARHTHADTYMQDTYARHICKTHMQDVFI